MPEWAQFLVWFSGSIISAGVIWRQGIRPAARFIRSIAVAVDTISDIATEFRPDHGSSLKDRVEDLQARLVRVEAAVAPKGRSKKK